MHSAILVASLLIRVKNMGVSKAMKELGSEYDVIPTLVSVFSTCLDRNIGECFVCTGELVINAEDYVCVDQPPGCSLQAGAFLHQAPQALLHLSI